MRNPWQFIFRFLGSLPFALGLIAVTATVVILGTILESLSQSHLYAAAYTYSHPLFGLLLGLYFVNILFSALSRWPFKKDHIPFLLTHLGLLMLIAGTLIKSFYGVQGNMHLIEGSGDRRITLPNTQALYVKTRRGQIKGFAMNDVIEVDKDLRLVKEATHTHAKVVRDAWITAEHLKIHGFDPIPLDQEVELPLDGAPWKVIASKKPIPHTPAKLPKLIVEKQADETQLLTVVTPHGDQISHVFNPKEFGRYGVYDEGFGGYTTLMSFVLPLETWEKSLNKISFEGLEWSAEEKKVGYWIWKVLAEFDPQDPLSSLQKSGWPLANEVQQAVDQEGDNANVYSLVAQQIAAVCDQLPAPEEELEDGAMLSALCLLNGLQPHEILAHIDWEKLQVKTSELTLESPLVQRVVALEPLDKLEDNLPALELRYPCGEKEEVVALGFDPGANGPFWPLATSQHQLRYQPVHQAIPHYVQLHQARQLFYPGTEQTYSYEADVTIHSPGLEPVETTLAMNQVYETADGYRFYLAGMSTHDPKFKRRVTLVINRDPAKYWLTYSGGIIMAFGIVLLGLRRMHA